MTECGVFQPRAVSTDTPFQFRTPGQDMTLPVSDKSEVTPSSPGSAWTLIGGLAVFVAILLTVYAYVFPRLSGEPVSPSASLEVRAAYRDAHEHSVEMTLPDSGKWFVSDEVLLTASDFRTFTTASGENGTPLLTLNCSTAGRKRLQVLRGTRGLNDLGIVLHSQLIACVALKDWSDESVTLALTGFSSSDANEVFARLTE
jgi:hypothetical protein